MTVSPDQHVNPAVRRAAVDEALAAVRIDGLPVSVVHLPLFAALAAGELTTDDIRERILARYTA
jgi:hypothetical protein